MTKELPTKTLEKLTAATADCGFETTPDNWHLNDDGSVILSLPPINVNGGLEFDRTRYIELAQTLGVDISTLRLTGADTIVLQIPPRELNNISGARTPWVARALIQESVAAGKRYS